VSANLRRFLEPRTGPRPGEVCELCAQPLADDHSHVVNLDSRNILCTCRACWLLFTHEGAAGGRYRAVGSRYLYDPAFRLSDADWDEIQIPVRMAFFFRNSSLGQMVAFYPSPAGATESLLPLDTWERVMRANPFASELAADVEGLILYRTSEGFDCYLTPIDACYELVGLVKLQWKGFDGGQEAWAAIEEFFAGLRRRSKVVEHG
jgi:hypothetical protein